MRVRVRLFATYREIVGKGSVSWTLDSGATLGDLLEAIVGAHPRLAGHRDTMLLAVNHEFADGSVHLQDGDEVAMMPPVSGGAS